MEFREFRNLLQRHVAQMTSEPETRLFLTDIDKDVLWETYLNSFPPGTNQVFRQRREFDCSCCRSFIKGFGNVVSITGDNQIVTIWDFQTADPTYQPVVDALSALVKAAPVTEIYITKQASIGTTFNHERLDNDHIQSWHHFHVDLPSRLTTNASESVESLMAPVRDARNVFQRSLKEISLDAIDTVLELIYQNSLYKGEEWKGALTNFRGLHQAYHELPEEQKDRFCWTKSISVGDAIAKIKNHSIGVLLVDITGGMDLDKAVRQYENIVAPNNYKRSKTIYTQKMVDEAKRTLEELGWIDSLGRRHAVLGDITINNILFADRDAARRMAGDVFAEMKSGATASQRQFDRVEEVGIDRFINDILPTAKSIQVWLENRHECDLVSLIAPTVENSPSMFKWSNAFGWAYNGNMTDSLKERVKAAGGKVDGVLRFSLQWNTEGGNRNDFDAHCIEPRGNEIYHGNSRNHETTGALDVDIVHPDENQVAVENITWSERQKMREGEYEFFVHNFNHRGGRSGFIAEIEFDGQIFSFDYPNELRQDEKVVVAVVKYSRKDGFQLIAAMNHKPVSRTIWNMKTYQFIPVSTVMYSPNYWDGQSGIGHRHYFFMLNGAVNDSQPNGFFNEFLNEDLMKHRRVFEALGARMRVEPAAEQLSGLGFSSTKRNSLIVKVTGSFERVIKLVF